MATKNAKIRKPMTSKKWGIICLVILLAVTAGVTYLAVCGVSYDPWIPISSKNWTPALPLNRALGGGTYKEYLLPEGTDDATAKSVQTTIKNRLSDDTFYREYDGDVSVDNGVLRIELRQMDDTRLSYVRNYATSGGVIEFTVDDAVLFTGKDVTDTYVGYDTDGKGQVSVYYLNMKLNDAAKAALNPGMVVTVTVDGDVYATNASLNNKGELEVPFSPSAYNTLNYLNAMWRTGTVDVDLSGARNISGELDAPLNIVLKVVLWVSAAMLALALIYVLIAGKLTGVSAFLSIWWAVMIELFLVAAVVISSITSLSAGCMIAILLGILLAVFTAVTRTDAISKQIGEGSAPKNATKVGFQITAKTVWILHGVALAAALIMMLIPVARPTGYCLCVGVLASAIAIVIMRAFQACFTAISNKPSNFGSAK